MGLLSRLGRGVGNYARDAGGRINHGLGSALINATLGGGSAALTGGDSEEITKAAMRSAAFGAVTGPLRSSSLGQLANSASLASGLVHTRVGQQVIETLRNAGIDPNMLDPLQLEDLVRNVMQGQRAQ